MSEPLVSPAERDTELVKRIIEWHRSRATAYLNAIPGYVADNAIDKARTFTGALVAHNETLAALLEDMAPPTQETEEPFVDPAERRRPDVAS